MRKKYFPLKSTALKFLCAALVLIILMGYQCGKGDAFSSSKVYKAVLKLDGGCTRMYGCVITSGSVDPALVDNNWKYKDQTYQKAFAVKNRCDFGGVKLDEEFSFEIINSSAKSCTQCYVYIGGFPEKSLSIRILK